MQRPSLLAVVASCALATVGVGTAQANTGAWLTDAEVKALPSAPTNAVPGSDVPVENQDTNADIDLLGAAVITGAAVSEIRADVISFQEVENGDTLKHFRARALGGRRAYPAAPRAAAAEGGNQRQGPRQLPPPQAPIIKSRSMYGALSARSPQQLESPSWPARCSTSRALARPR